MPRHKAWTDRDAAGYSATALEVMDVVGALDNRDPLDARILAECALRGPGVSDPDGAHAFLGGPGVWGVRPRHVGPAEDCPYCGSVATFDAAGNPAGYAMGPVQARPGGPTPGSYDEHGRYVPGPPGRAEPTVDTCVHCSRSGIDREIVAHRVRQDGRLGHLIALKLTQGESPMPDEPQSQQAPQPRGIAPPEPDPNRREPPARQAVAPGPPSDPAADQKARQIHNALQAQLARAGTPGGPPGAAAGMIGDAFRGGLEAFRAITPEQWSAFLAFARSLGLLGV